MKRIIGSFLALSLLASSAAFAGPQNPDDRDDRNPRAQHDGHAKHDGRAPRQAQGPQRGPQSGPDRRDDHRDSRRGHQRGERLAVGHRGDRVPDYGKHGLKRPPRGHEWRRVDNQYVLIAVATGVIASVVAAR